MQAHYPFAFEREMGCTENELRAWLPEACGGRAIGWGARGAELTLEGGRVAFEWQALAPRRIALITVPRLAVRFESRGVSEAAWQRFMRHFDLVAQRGGG
jgi:hypothetical protein